MTGSLVEHGDRDRFLARIRDRQGAPATTGPHPPPPPPSVVPEVAYRSLDGLDPGDPEALLPVFVAAATAAEATVDVVDGEVPGQLLGDLAARHGVQRVVHSVEPVAVSLGEAFAELGIEVGAYDPAFAATADLAVTGATHALASTGSVVVDTSSAGSRAVSLLARVHLCVVALDALVATHADVLRSPSRPMPSCRVVITGPSRTGDIEQRLTLGAHGPVALHIVVVR